MLAFIRNRFAGSYRALSRASPAYFSAPPMQFGGWRAASAGQEWGRGGRVNCMQLLLLGELHPIAVVSRRMLSMITVASSGNSLLTGQEAVRLGVLPVSIADHVSGADKE